MTKAEEIKILSDAAKKLGDDSYLGPALRSLIPYIERELSSDVCPDLLGLVKDLECRVVSLKEETERLSVDILRRISEREQILAQIETRKATLNDVQFDIDRCRDRAYEALSSLKSHLGGV